MYRARGIAVILLALLTLMAIPALAAEGDFTLDEDQTMAGMNYLSWRRGYEPTVANDAVTICLPLTSERAKGRVKATLIMADEAVSPLRPQKMDAEFYPDKGLYAVKLTLKLLSGRMNGDYSGVVRVEGVDEDGQALWEEFPVVLRIRDGRDSPDALRPILSQVSADLHVGEPGEVIARLTNTSPVAEMTGIQLIVSDSAGEVIPGQSDKLALPDLMPGESCDIHYPVMVLPKAGVSPHALKFSLSYRAAGQEGSWEETFTLPVLQDIRLENGGIQTAGTVIQGDNAVLSLPLMNMGRGELANVMATLSIPGIVERQSVLVGSIPAGETRQAKLTFVPGRETLGDYEGTLAVTCEDAWGNQEGFTLPVSITVEAPAPSKAEGLSAVQKEEKHSLVLPYALGGACLVLALMLILQGALLRRKIHRMEEERL